MFVENNVYRISKLEARALLAHSSDDAARGSLYNITFGGGRIAAIDGPRLAVLRGEGSVNAPDGLVCLVSADVLERATKLVEKNGAIRVTIEPGNLATVEVLDAQGGLVVLMRSAITGDWRAPPYMQVIPRKPAGRLAPRTTAFGVNPAYLVDLEPVWSAACDGCRSGGVTVYPPMSALDPVLVTAGEAIGEFNAWTVVIMPVRITEDDSRYTDHEVRAMGLWETFVTFCERTGSETRSFLELHS